MKTYFAASRIVCFLLLLFACITLQAQSIIYVTPNGTGNQSGSSWTNAAAGSQLQNKINEANSGSQVWIAAGIYKPNAYPSGCRGCSSPRNYAFVLKSDIAVYGGFSGVETSLSQRTGTNPTILSGDIGTAGDASDNCYHVVISTNNNSSTILDGFTITGGNANVYSSINTSAYISSENGSGLYMVSSSGQIRNCIFYANNARTLSSPSGGSIFINFSSPSIINCVFFANSYNSQGSAVGIANCTSPVHITGCTFYNDAGGSEILNHSSSLVITNSILWSNGLPISTNSSAISTIVSYCLVRGGYPGTGNLDKNPLFFNSSDPDGADNILGSSDDGLRLQIGSPAINNGRNDSIPADITTDITGSARIQNGTVDMGAYEGFPCPFYTTLYVDNSVTSSGDGSSWASAFKELRDALNAAQPCSNITTINVAKGTYKPTNDTNRDSAFTIYRGGLKIYGGYPSGGGTRNVTANPTILSGDIGAANDSTDNSYHVMVIAGIAGAMDSVVVDGFTMTGGNASGSGSVAYNGVATSRSRGAGAYLAGNNGAGKKIAIRNGTVAANNAGEWAGGLYNEMSSPLISSCVFTGNHSTGGNGAFNDAGGAVLNYNSSSPLIINSVFTGNSSRRCGGVFSWSSCQPALINCTFTNNSTATTGSSLYNEVGTTATATNCIFWGNSGVNIYNDNTSATTVTYSDVQESYSGTGNISSNPLFTNTADADGADNVLGTADDGLKLQAGSPAITAGSNAAIPAGVTTDITGAARIQNVIVDMGAYEGTACPAFSTLYVDNNIATSGDGSSWTSAFKELRDALMAAAQCSRITTINVAKGTYKPTATTVRDSAFAIYRPNLKLYGGYPSGGGTRNITANPTILSGDIGTQGSNADNSYHVMVIAGAVSATDSIVVDGFTIQDGNATLYQFFYYNRTQEIYQNEGGGLNVFGNTDGTKVAVRNCSFRANSANNGGALSIVINANTHPVLAPVTITNCSFTDNNGSQYGGAVYTYNSSSVISHCSFSGNAVQSYGGALGNLNSTYSQSVVNCTFSYNTAKWGGGVSNTVTQTAVTGSVFYNNRLTSNVTTGAGIYNEGPGQHKITGCTFYANPGGSDCGIANIYTSSLVSISNTIISGTKPGIYNSSSTPSVTYSLVQGGYTGTGNINASPLFANANDADGSDDILGTADDGLKLLPGSPAVDAGRNDSIPAGITTDITGAARIQNGTVDMGAYEGFVCPSFTTLYVDSRVTASGDGSSWTSAFKELRDALMAAKQCSSIATINVAKGTYKPTNNTNRDSAFVIYRGGLKLYGGYPSGGGTRNMAANPTILSGDIGAANDTSDNSYHVMVIAGISAATDSVVVDGFTLQGGNGGGPTQYNYNGQNVWRHEGAGIMLWNNGSNVKIAVRNCTVTQNYSTDGGGGAIILCTSDLRFSNCIFTQNKVKQLGGGVYNYKSPAVFSQCDFTQNSSTLDGGGFYGTGANNTFTQCNWMQNEAQRAGGGLINSNSSVVAITQCNFKGNAARTFSGGAVYNASSSFLVNQCHFLANTAFEGGGGLVSYSANGTPKINNSSFAGNTASYGGGVYNQNSNTAIANCVFSNNTATLNGGAVDNNTSYATVSGCTFSGNTSAHGASVNLDGTATVTVNNSIFAGAVAHFYKYNGTLNVTYSDVQGGYAGVGNINADPLFINPADADGGDDIFGTSDDGLRLQIASPAQNTGSSAAIPSGIINDIKGEPRISNCTVDMGAYEVFDNVNLYWTGLVSNDWSNSGNWCSSVPGNGASVVIPVSAPYAPVLNADVTAGNVVIAAGTGVSIGTHTFTVNGTVSGTGVLIGSPSSNLTTGAGGTVYFSGAADGHVLHNLQVTGGTLTLGSALDIAAGRDAGTVTVSGAGQLATGGYLTLKSDALGTASVAQGAAAGGYIMGNVTAERYTDGGKPDVGRRAWRLISYAVTGVTMHDAWQEGAQNSSDNPVLGYGTKITGQKLDGATAESLGFDYIGGGNNTSVKQFTVTVTGSPTATTNTWDPIPQTPGTGTKGITFGVNSKQAYMLFVRGDRTVGATGQKPANLRSTGLLRQGTQTVTLSPGNSTLAGNPYASALDFSKLRSHNSNLKDQFYLWNSSLGDYGAYVLISKAGGSYQATPSPLTGSGTAAEDAYRYIPSGAGFFVSPATPNFNASPGSFTIEESDKAAPGNQPPANTFREVSSQNVRQLLMNLNLKGDTASQLADGFRALFSDDYLGHEEENSSRKTYNFNENLNLIRDGKAYIMQARGDVKQNDTLYMRLWYASKRKYELQMRADNFTPAPGIRAWLVDGYLGTKQELSLQGDVVTVGFEVNGDTLSAKNDRFMIVFTNAVAATLPVTLTNVKATPHKEGVSVSWTVTNEVNIQSYTVERSTDGNVFTTIGTQTVKNSSGAVLAGYESLDAQPAKGDNLYRIRIEEKDGSVTYSSVVKASVNSSGSGINVTVYPNPATTKATVHIDDAKADMSIWLTDEKGSLIWKKEKITDTNTSIPVAQLTNGSYLVTIKDKQKIIKTIKLVKAD